MELEHPLRVVTSAVDGDVLAVLARAEASFTPPGLRALIGDRSEEGIRKSLSRLVDQGIVLRESVGNARAYRLNRTHLAAEHIIGLASMRELLFERVGDILAEWSPPAELVVLFGSGAKRTMRPTSDIDLFVVRPDAVDLDHPAWSRQVHQLQDQVTGWTGNDTRVLEYDVTEVLDGINSGDDPVLVDIQEDGIRLGGRRRSLAALVRSLG